MKNRAVILARVSKSDQSVDRQVSELTAYAQDKSLEVLEVITENVSGAKSNEDRQAIQRVLELAKAKKIDKVLVHEVSRLGRDTAQVLATLETLHKHSVSILVMNYQLETLNANGTPNPMAQFLLTILTDISRMERLTLIERTKSGLEEARRKGKVLGRPKGVTKDILAEHPKVVKYLNAKKTIRETAKLLDVSVSTVQRVKKALS